MEELKPRILVFDMDGVLAEGSWDINAPLTINAQKLDLAAVTGAGPFRIEALPAGRLRLRRYAAKRRASRVALAHGSGHGMR